MNREKKDQLPAMQVGFIDSICLPVYDVRSHYFVCLKFISQVIIHVLQAFANLTEKLTPLLDGVNANREQWQKLDKQQRERQQQHNGSNGEVI